MKESVDDGITVNISMTDWLAIVSDEQAKEINNHYEACLKANEN